MNASRLVLLAAAAALVAVTATAAEPESGDAARRVAGSGTAGADYEPLPLGVGLRVFIDPETGQFRKPTAAELAAIAENARASKNKSSEGLEVEYRPDGSRHVNLQGRFMHSMRVAVSDDGSLHYVCSDRDHDHTKPAVAPAAPADR